VRYNGRAFKRHLQYRPQYSCRGRRVPGDAGRSADVFRCGAAESAVAKTDAETRPAQPQARCLTTCTGQALGLSIPRSPRHGQQPSWSVDEHRTQLISGDARIPEHGDDVDQEMALLLRKKDVKTILVANKADNPKADLSLAEFGPAG